MKMINIFAKIEKQKERRLKKIVGEINKALKIIIDEDFMEFTRRLNRRITYGLISNIKARLTMNKRFYRIKVSNKTEITEKKIIPCIQTKNSRIEIERFFLDIKEDILKIRNK